MGWWRGLRGGERGASLSRSPPGTGCQNSSKMKECMSVCTLDDKGMHVCGYLAHSVALSESEHVCVFLLRVCHCLAVTLIPVGLQGSLL